MGRIFKNTTNKKLRTETVILSIQNQLTIQHKQSEKMPGTMPVDTPPHRSLHGPKGDVPHLDELKARKSLGQGVSHHVLSEGQYTMSMTPSCRRSRTKLKRMRNMLGAAGSHRVAHKVDAWLIVLPEHCGLGLREAQLLHQVAEVHSLSRGIAQREELSLGGTESNA